ncbi:MAG TPA: DUF4386 family protein [Actinomycetota bacterium]|nr:DUF4386 family protein [Actinomycetota bacterium]
MSAHAADAARLAPARDLRSKTRWLAALVIPIGPAAVALLRFVLPYFTAPDSKAIVKSVVTKPDSQSAVLWLGLLAMLTLIPGVIWVGRVTRHAAPRLTAAALLLLVPGYISLSGLLAGDLLLWIGAEQGVDQNVVAAMYETAHPTTYIAMGIFVLGHVVGTILLGLAMWRSSRVPRWAAVITVVSQPLHFAAAFFIGSPPLDLVAWGLNAAGFAAVSAAVIRMSDDQWDLPPAPVNEATP